MIDHYNIGIDIGGTNIRGGVARGSELGSILSERLNAGGTAAEVVQQVFAFTDRLMNDQVQSIGIGVPGLVDQVRGFIFDVVNIPAWKELPLRHLMEERYGLPVFINNDANCFALGEYYFGDRGTQKDFDTAQTMVGLTIGTGLGSGMIVDGKLYSGSNCAAGEFGMIDYLDHCYEYYASGQFFANVYNEDGTVVFQRAVAGDKSAVRMYQEMGAHLGNAIKAMLYAVEPDLIVIGGTVRYAWPYFQQAMWERIQTFAYRRIVAKLKIEVSKLENSGILGAAALQYNHLK